MAAIMHKSAFSGVRSARTPARSSVRAAAASRPLWAPNVVAPEYLKGELAGDYGWDPLGLGADPKALKW